MQEFTQLATDCGSLELRDFQLQKVIALLFPDELMHMSSAIPWVGTLGKGGDFVKNDMQRTQITPCTRGMTSIKVEIFPLLPQGVTDTK